MNTHLKNLSGPPPAQPAYVSAYITNYVSEQPLTYGALTIVDNTENNISTFLSYYGFHIDNVFIAGGYGFRTLEDISKAKGIIDDFDEFQQQLSQSLEALNNKRVNFKFTYLQSVDGGGYVDYNILSPKYNSYGFITSYNFLKLQGTGTANNYTYNLSINEQSLLKYVDNISVKAVNGQNNNEDVVEVNNLEELIKPKFKVKVEVSQDNYENFIPNEYNENIKIYLNSEKNTFGPLVIENSELTTFNYEFDKPNDKFEDDLQIKIVDESNNVIYSYIFENYLKWYDKYSYFPTSSSNDIENINNFNFRTSRFSLSESDPNTVFSELITNQFQDINLSNLEFNKLIDITFESNEPSYDYIIFRNNYDDIGTVEFYFNGFKSNNWYCEKLLMDGEVPYYIYQSPQMYQGKHVWQIKINI